MCGINGFFGRNSCWKSQIEMMNNRIRHRGPDCQRYWHKEEDELTLGHTRLSILDVSENGSQPMESKDGRYVLALNGEIYNFRNLKNTLLAEKECFFKGHSDTEVLVEYISYYGLERTLEDIIGMYSFALYDIYKKKIYLVRDRIGEKPLYYGFVGDGFIFSSEISAITECEKGSCTIDNDALSIYFKHGYIPSPYSIYKEIKKLSPGCVLELNYPFKNDNVVINKYWNIEDVAKKGEDNPFLGTYNDAVKELDHLIRDSIELQMVADVPLGAFLSGGIDSSTVVSVMQHLSNNNIKTFTIGFDDETYNEAVYSKQIADYLGTNHHEFYVGEKEITDVIPKLAYIYGEPFADSSQIPTFLVSKLAKESVTVSLSGDGGDELFCGYNSYNKIPYLWNKINLLPQNVRNMASRVLFSDAIYGCGKMSLLKRYINSDSPEDIYIRTSNYKWTEKLLYIDNNPLYTYNTYKKGLLKDIESNIMLMDMMMYHPDDILVKVDRSAMAVSLESRIPLLDKRIIEFAWSLPIHYKRENGEYKKIIKDVLYQYVPKGLMERPKKGFSIPVLEWIKNGELRDWAEDLLSEDKIVREGILDYLEVKKTWDTFIKHGINGNMVWYLLMFEEWMDKCR